VQQFLPLFSTRRKRRRQRLAQRDTRSIRNDERPLIISIRVSLSLYFGDPINFSLHSTVKDWKKGEKKKKKREKTVGVNGFLFNDWPLFFPPSTLSVCPSHLLFRSAGFRVRQRFGMCFPSELKKKRETETLTQKVMGARNTRSEHNRRSWERRKRNKTKSGRELYRVIKDASICYRKNKKNWRRGDAILMHFVRVCV